MPEQPVVIENETRTPLLIFSMSKRVVVVVAQIKMRIPPLMFGVREGGGAISMMWWLYRGGGAYLVGAPLHGPPGAGPLSSAVVIVFSPHCHCGPPIHHLQ